jgi:hypothetical protein
MEDPKPTVGEKNAAKRIASAYSRVITALGHPDEMDKEEDEAAALAQVIANHRKDKVRL